ncbi:MAG: AMP-binding protein [Pelistega sp.]|nr:AMP-binding protein [Pelistega sp.]
MKGRASFGRTEGAAWIPTTTHFDRSRLAAMMKRCGFTSLEEFHHASIDNPEWFWAEAAKDLGIPLRNLPTPGPVIDETEGRAFPKWFNGSRLNIVESCVDRHAENPLLANRIAVVYEADNGIRHSLTFAELKQNVDQFATGLLRLGIKQNDRIAFFMPPVPEATIALMACAKIGAIGVPTFSGYGSEPLASRLQAAQAKVIITVDSTTRRGKTIPMKAIADEALLSSSSVEHLIVIRLNGNDIHFTENRDYWWHDILCNLSEHEPPVQLNPNQPLLIIYTSGTTGAPKGIVHSHIGYALKSAVDFGYAFDLQEGDMLAWITDMGWMLGPLMIVGSLQCGSSVTMIEGLPDYPSTSRLWDIVQRNKVTVLGISPSAARNLRISSAIPNPSTDISTLRAFTSTGEAWDLTSWNWLFKDVGQSKLPILNYSGGTETGGGILSCYTITPQSPGSLSGPLPGIDVDVLNSDGNATQDIGELVIHNTWVGMTHGFWNDDERYIETYWKQWPNTWVHGDLASIDGHGFWHIHGRSDDTLKISGRRIGPSEIETALISLPFVAEAAVIGVPDAMKGQVIVAFIVMRSEADKPSDHKISEVVSSTLGKALAPSKIHCVKSLPKTKNGKIMRRLIRAYYLKQDLGDISSLDPLTPLAHIPRQA